MNPKLKKEPLRILLADDDKDDRFFFEKALQALPFPTQLTTVEDGKKLMIYLQENSADLPDVLFLDLNMPLKNGSECLAEIKDNEQLKKLPVVIYSTSLHEDVAELLYQKGAHYYVRKTDLADLEKILFNVLTLLTEKASSRPSRAEFIISLIGTHS
jgi:CheY-like chemotaxis protein